MLRVYARHYPPCQSTDGNYRKCRCPKWINGNLPTGNFVRISAQTRSWEHAERKARVMEYEVDPFRTPIASPNPRVKIETAVKEFLEDEIARQLAETTRAQSVSLLQKQLLAWAGLESLIFLDELTTPKLRQFRGSWGKPGLYEPKEHTVSTGFRVLK